MNTKNVLFITGVALMIYGVYGLYKMAAGGCGCGKKPLGSSRNNDSNLNIVPDTWLKDFDTSNQAVFPLYYQSKDYHGDPQPINEQVASATQALIQ